MPGSKSRSGKRVPETAAGQVRTALAMHRDGKIGR